MSCNGCRVLRKGCSDACVLRPSIEWIDGPQAQAHATVFVAKFFGRAGLVASLAAVPLPHRPALFRSLLYEACGRTINPVSGAIGLMWTGNWDLCQAAAEAVLRGETLRPSLNMAIDDDMEGLYRNVGSSTGAGGSLSSSPENSSSAPLLGKRKKACGDEKLPVMQCELDLCLMPRSPPARDGGRRRGGTPEEYSTTTCEEGGNNNSRLVDMEGAGPTLLNLFH